MQYIINDADPKVSVIRGRGLEFRNEHFELLHRQLDTDIADEIPGYKARATHLCDPRITELLKNKDSMNCASGSKEFREAAFALRSTLRAERRAFYTKVLRAEISEEELDASNKILVSCKRVVLIGFRARPFKEDTSLRAINWGDDNILDDLALDKSVILSILDDSPKDTRLLLSRFIFKETKEAFALINDEEPFFFKIAENEEYDFLELNRSSYNIGSRDYPSFYKKSKSPDSPFEQLLHYNIKTFLCNIFSIPGKHPIVLVYHHSSQKLYVYLNPIDFFTETDTLTKFTYEVEAFHKSEEYRFFRFIFDGHEFFAYCSHEHRPLLGLRKLATPYTDGTEVARMIKSSNSLHSLANNPHVVAMTNFSRISFDYHTLHYLNNDELIVIDHQSIGFKPDISSFPRIYNRSPKSYYAFPKKIWQNFAPELTEDLCQMDQICKDAAKSDNEWEDFDDSLDWSSDW